MTLALAKSGDGRSKPIQVAKPIPSAAGADVGVAVVAVDPPGVQDPLHVAVVAHPAHVVHDLVPGGPPGRPVPMRLADLVQGLVPGDALPETLAAIADPLHGVEDPLRDPRT